MNLKKNKKMTKPLTVKAVVIAAELCLTPQRRPKLVDATLANDDSKHVMLNTGTNQNIFVVFRSTILDLQMGEEGWKHVIPCQASWVSEHALDHGLEEDSKSVVFVEVGYRGSGGDRR